MCHPKKRHSRQKMNIKMADKMLTLRKIKKKQAEDIATYLILPDRIKASTNSTDSKNLT
jgi:hypothetical protein